MEKARAAWRRMTRILSREGERPRVFGFFFKSVVQSVLLFGVETWVLTPCMVLQGHRSGGPSQMRA